jgi:hypothetical protein
MTVHTTAEEIGTFYWVFPDANPWSLSLLDQPQPTR